jgi:hypothetical protein
MGLSASFYPQKILPILAMGRAGLPFPVFGFSGFTARERPVAKLQSDFFTGPDECER